ncbi:MAG TPA: hypothetical protein VGJ92_12355 [Methanocella sp.]|jgi:hypothetical protein
MERNLQTFIFLMASHDPAAEEEKIAKIIDWGTDRDTYHAGDRPVAFIEIRNTSGQTIDDATVKLTVTRKTPLGAITIINGKVYKAGELLPGFSIPPGKSKRFEVSPFQIPDTSLAKGSYQLKAEIIVRDHPVGLIFKDIMVK